MYIAGVTFHPIPQPRIPVSETSSHCRRQRLTVTTLESMKGGEEQDFLPFRS